MIDRSRWRDNVCAAPGVGALRPHQGRRSRAGRSRSPVRGRATVGPSWELPVAGVLRAKRHSHQQDSDVPAVLPPKLRVRLHRTVRPRDDGLPEERSYRRAPAGGFYRDIPIASYEASDLAHRRPVWVGMKQLCVGMPATLHAALRDPVSAMTRAQAGTAGTIASLIASGAELASGLATNQSRGRAPQASAWRRQGRAESRFAWRSARALCRTRTDDPFLTMEVLYQLS
jgi:hypothetical protein